MAASYARPASRRVWTRNRLAVAVAVGVLAAGTLIGASLVSSQAPKRATTAPLVGVPAALELFGGLPQHGFTVGSPAAPLTIEEYADLQCPYCRRFASDVLPTVVNDYVRTGKAKLVFRPLTFVGDDSVRAGRLVTAAARQGALWQLVDVLYANQGAENTGWASQQLLDGAGLATGLNVKQANAFAQSGEADAQLQASAARAASLGVRSTPTLVLIRSGQAPVVLNDVVDPASVLAALAAA
jgi:protein-disulfide isomerase